MISTIGLCCFYFAYAHLLLGGEASAFAPHHGGWRKRKLSPCRANDVSSTTTRIRGGGPDDGNVSGGGDAFFDLTSSLARLDNQWKIQQAGKGPKSRWSKLFLPKDPEEEPEEVGAGEVWKKNAATSGSYFPEVRTQQDPNDYVWILDPPGNSIPSCIIVFTGGAALGQFPHVAYNELLVRVSDKLNALCIAAPYSVDLDHFKLAKQTGERIRRALVYLEDDPSRPYKTMPPIYALGHSLGCKLATIYACATGQDYDGLGFMAFNNFSFSRTIKMARTFAEELRKSTSSTSANAQARRDDLLGGIFDFAELAVGAIGVDFTPNAQDTSRLVTLRYDDRLQSKTRVFVFDNDNLDSSQDFVDACSGGGGPSLCGLQGGHLSPVYFKWAMDDLTGFEGGENIPPEARDIAKEAMGGLQSASFGDEAALNELVDAICDWILGKPPKRKPNWAVSSDDYQVPKITGNNLNA
ncbi:DUF1350 domain containing protein [Nitzschia inconspicua]|uniref:DUF1350 domain containing protein n=1 Tax=Nitzschia inconspicua TaxID=303405 RepID=A0A9K3LM61_9STRA|nr:DUF1350 domain containing protein [Nitzschia inconspicua]